MEFVVGTVPVVKLCVFLDSLILSLSLELLNDRLPRFTLCSEQPPQLWPHWCVVGLLILFLLRVIGPTESSKDGESTVLSGVELPTLSGVAGCLELNVALVIFVRLNGVRRTEALFVESFLFLKSWPFAVGVPISLLGREAGSSLEEVRNTKYVNLQMWENKYGSDSRRSVAHHLQHKTLEGLSKKLILYQTLLLFC